MVDVCTPTYTHALIFPKPMQRAKKVAGDISKTLEKYGISTQILEQDATTPLPNTPQGKTLGVVLGGDGTFLAAGRRVYGHDIPLVGINFGHLGFLTEIDCQNFETHLNKILCGPAYEKERPYLLAHVKRDGKTILKDSPLLNEATLTRGDEERMLHFTLQVGDKQVTSSRGDGLIVSTPTGSTAYNLSAGGPILHPGLEALVIAPICPHTLAFRPIVVPQRDITVTLEQGAGQLTLDGQNILKLEQGDTVILHRSKETLRLLLMPERNFFQRLREKLGWDNPI